MYINVYISTYKGLYYVFNYIMDTKEPVENVETKNNKSFVEDGMSTSDIRKTIQYLRAYIEKGGSTSLEDRVAQLKLEHSFFEERYPMLFEMCTRPDFNMDNLNYFLNKRDEIIENRISTEDASKQIGKEWFDKYVDKSKLKKK